MNRYYTGRRMWRVFDLLAPSLHLDPSAGHVAAEPKYPFAVRPEKKVGVRTLIEVHRDYYEGTRARAHARAARPTGSAHALAPAARARAP